MFKVIRKEKSNGVFQFPSTILKQVSEDVEVPISDPEITKVVEKLVDWEERHPKSQGLSAVQLGVAKRIAVIRMNGKLMTIVNPKLLCKFGSQMSNEGCHSLNEDRYVLRRNTSGLLKYYDVNGLAKYIWLNKKYIRLIQHELDHMDGILINEKGTHYNANSDSGNTTKS